MTAFAIAQDQAADEHARWDRKGIDRMVLEPWPKSEPRVVRTYGGQTGAEDRAK